MDLFVHLHFLLKVSMLRLFFNVEYFSIDFISSNKDVTLFFVQYVGLSIWISSFISFIFNLFSIMPVSKLKANRLSQTAFLSQHPFIYDVIKLIIVFKKRILGNKIQY